MNRCHFDSCPNKAEPLSHYCRLHGLGGPSGPRIAGVDLALTGALTRSLWIARSLDRTVIGTEPLAIMEGVLVSGDIRLPVHPVFQVLGALARSVSVHSDLSRSASSRVEYFEYLSVYSAGGGESTLFQDHPSLRLPRIAPPFLVQHVGLEAAGLIAHDALLTFGAAAPFGIGPERTKEAILTALTKGRVSRVERSPVVSVVRDIIRAYVAAFDPRQERALFELTAVAAVVGRLEIEIAFRRDLGL